jgi:hypothetical protein
MGAHYLFPDNWRSTPNGGPRMTYRKINVLTELRNLANGKPTKAPAEVIAGCAIPLVQAGMRDRELDELERLYRLED